MSLSVLISSPSCKGILLASMLIPPVPYLRTFSAIVFSLIGFLAKTINSWAGLSAVPHPSHSFASSVAGSVILTIDG